MSKLMFVAAASLLAIATQAALAQEAHESPDATSKSSEGVRVEVEAGRLHSPYDLASSGLSREDLVLVSAFTSSGTVDGSSRNDY